MAKMQWSLFLLILMGSFLTCQQNEYHFIKEKKTWDGARKYCREKYTDLVTWTDMKSLCNTMKNPQAVWIRLHNLGKTKQHLPQSGVENKAAEAYFDIWRHQPVNRQCVMVNDECRPSWENCDEKKSFFCFDDKVILINKNKTWEEALYYCREKYRDLVSITNPDELSWVKKKAKIADSPFVWLGLRYTCTLDFWFWVSDEVVSHENWDSDGQINECDMSGAMKREGHKWFSRHDNEKYNFICAL